MFFFLSVGDVVSGKADIAADGLAVSEIRMNDVDFAEPILVDDIVMVSKLQAATLPYLNFDVLAALSVYSWAILIILTISTSFIIYWAEKLIYLRSNVENSCNILTYGIGLLFQRDIGGLVPKNLGSRLISIALATALMIVMTTYTAVLTTRNIEDRKTLPISGLKDPKVIQLTEKFKIATYKDSFISQMFENSHRTVWTQLGYFMKNYNFNNFPEAYQQLQQGDLHACIIHKVGIETGWKNNRFCDVQIVEHIRKEALAFALRKNSSWTEPISNLMREYKENGVLNQIKTRYMSSKCTLKIGDHPKQFSLLYLSGACIMLILGVIVSVIIFILEHIVNICAKRFVVKRRSSSELRGNIDR